MYALSGTESISTGHSAGAHETLEMLDGILESFDSCHFIHFKRPICLRTLNRAAPSKAEQRRAKLYAAR